MKIGPDGSLCRITSSYKDMKLKNHVGIIKVPGSAVPSFKLVIIRPEKEVESSEKSDEELSDEEIILDFKFPAKDVEKEKDNEVQIDKVDKTNETVNKEIVEERSYHKKNQINHNRKNNYRFFNRRNNSFGGYKSMPNMEENYSYDNRNFNSQVVPYNKTTQISAAAEISPWLNPSVMMPNYEFQSFPHIPYPENSRKSVGLLGHHPSFSNSLSNYQPNKQNSTYTPMTSNFIQDPSYSSRASNFTINNTENFICDQNPPYSSMAQNFATNNQETFNHDQNYWNDDYRKYPKNNRRQNMHANTKNRFPRKNNSWNRRRRKSSEVKTEARDIAVLWVISSAAS